MTTNYATIIKDIKNKLKETIKGTTTFATHTYASYIAGGAHKSANPIALIRVRQDRFSPRGPNLTEGILMLEVWVDYLGTHEEDSLDKMIDYVGEIVDAIEANRTLGSSYVNNTEVNTVDFTFREVSQTALKHTARIIISVEFLRNI